jgi:hypothetical protein
MRLAVHALAYGIVLAIALMGVAAHLGGAF